MHYKQDSLVHGTEAVPTLLAIDHTVLPHQKMWIGEYARCRLEVNTSMASFGLSGPFPGRTRCALVIHNVSNDLGGVDIASD
jgi:hypothetical protein